MVLRSLANLVWRFFRVSFSSFVIFLCARDESVRESEQTIERASGKNDKLAIQHISTER